MDGGPIFTDRDVLVRFLAFLEARGTIDVSSEALADEFLTEADEPVPADLVDGPEVDLRPGGIPVAVRGATRSTLFLTEDGRDGRRFTIVSTPGGDHVMILWGPPVRGRLAPRRA